jgi:hypothetical protein
MKVISKKSIWTVLSFLSLSKARVEYTSLVKQIDQLIDFFLRIECMDTNPQAL